MLQVYMFSVNIVSIISRYVGSGSVCSSSYGRIVVVELNVFCVLGVRFELKLQVIQLVGEVINRWCWVGVRVLWLVMLVIGLCCC